MSRKTLTLAIASAAGAAVAVAGSANAAYQNNMFNTGLDPSSYGNLVASLDGNSPGGSAHPVQNFDWPFQAGSFTNSGHALEVGASLIDQSNVRTEVFEVHTQQTFNDGGDSVTLNPGDRVWAYHIRLVGSSGVTVNSLAEVHITGFGIPGNNDSLATGLLKGRGFNLGDFYGGGVPSALNTPTAVAGDLDDTGGFFGGSVDFQWIGDDTQQMDNNHEITLLLFSEPAPIGFGLANLVGDPGQSGNSDPNGLGAPILIPYVPAPGVLGLAGVAAVFGARRRR